MEGKARWRDENAEEALRGRRILAAHEAFSERLREVRAKRGLTQQQLADRLDGLGYRLDRIQIGRIEKGKRKPTLEDVLAFAYALDVAPVQLIVTRDGEARMRVVPGVRPDGPGIVGPWIAGIWPLGDQDRLAFHLELPDGELDLARELARKGRTMAPYNMPHIRAAVQIFEAAEHGARREEEDHDE